MDDSGKRWIVNDRDGNPIYLTDERWRHITDSENHPEMLDFEEILKTTLRQGRRTQEPLNPRKYRYVHFFGDLPGEFNHAIAIVLFSFDVDEQGLTVPNNFVATAFLKHIRPKGGRE
jgi:hypothetical protein